jgi:hypothetical protein|tara:strand:- start:80 stop:289 length:210 start_codon:yes stop_codon:yes gene_type:complete
LNDLSGKKPKHQPLNYTLAIAGKTLHAMSKRGYQILAVNHLTTNLTSKILAPIVNRVVRELEIGQEMAT